MREYHYGQIQKLVQKYFTTRTKGRLGHFDCGIYFGGMFLSRILKAYIHGTALYVITYGILILASIIIFQKIKLNKQGEK